MFVYRELALVSNTAGVRILLRFSQQNNYNIAIFRGHAGLGVEQRGRPRRATGAGPIFAQGLRPHFQSLFCLAEQINHEIAGPRRPGRQRARERTSTRKINIRFRAHLLPISGQLRSQPVGIGRTWATSPHPISFSPGSATCGATPVEVGPRLDEC